MAESDMTAQKWKEEGDKEFNQSNWSKALSHYTKAIELATDDTEKGLYYDKRAATYFELRDYDKAIEDCDSAMLKIFHNVSITLFRRFLALIELEKFEEAFEKDQDEKIISSCSNDILPEHIVAQFREILDKHIKKRASESCNKGNVSRTKSTMINVVLPWCLEMINNPYTEIVNASQYCLQNILNTCCGRNDKPDSIPDEALCKKHKKVIDKILSCLLDKIENETTTSIARDALIKFITRNIHYTALHWAKRLVEFGGLQKLMEVASQCESGYYDGYYNLFDITSSTQTITSVCLAKIDENLDENDKEEFFNIINGFIREELNSNDIACHRLNDLLIKQVICEFIYVVVTRYDESNTFIGRSITTLGILCYTEDLDNFEDLDNSENLNTSEDLHDSENLKDSIRSWLKVCRPFLINPQRDMKKWAVEGLSYLTFDLKIKNKLIEDQRAIRAIIEFAKTENQSILYQEWNKKGGKEFIHERWSKAISHYTKAIELTTDDTEKGLYYDNQAAAYFEHDDYDKVSQMMNLAFNVSADQEKRQNAMITLLILARWRTAYEIFIKEVEKNDNVICSAIRIVDESCKNNGSRTKFAMINAVLPWCLEMMNSTFTERVNASEYCLLNVLISGMNDEPNSKPDETLTKKHKKVIDKILSCLLDWAERLVELRGLQKLMEWPVKW
ncbi:protein unc-45 homolog B-like [Temnothorax curvispinosus]|uniref:Protein unc-45 homolog B-like n=1 Tax=Temnothorax curvispinosus TaxID=300111 RepID=A0A6J1QPZ1_9HYME|nr:protein unc-45 homolog B-like [Temnothorax curvispinosus]